MCWPNSPKPPHKKTREGHEEQKPRVGPSPPSKLTSHIPLRLNHTVQKRSPAYAGPPPPPSLGSLCFRKPLQTTPHRDPVLAPTHPGQSLRSSTPFFPALFLKGQLRYRLLMEPFCLLELLAAEHLQQYCHLTHNHICLAP